MGLFTKSNSAATAVAKPATDKNADAIASAAALIASPPSALTPVYNAPVSNAPVSNKPAVQTERQLYIQQLKVRIHQQLVERLDVQNLKALPPETVRAEVRVLVRDLCQSEKGLLNSAEQEKLMDDVMDETFGLGPLEILLRIRRSATFW